MNNVESVREGYAAFARADLDTIREKLSPDVVWHVPGRSPLAGDYRGIDAVLGYFGELFTLSGGTFTAELVECGEIAPDLVACLVRLGGQMPGGPVDQQVMQLFKRADDRTTEVWSFAEDVYALDEASAETGVARTRRAYELFARGDLDAIRDMLHPDVTWHVGGRSAISGTYRGIDAVFGYFAKLFELSGGTFKAELLECGEIAPETVHCLVRITGDLPGGRLDTTVVQTFREVDGKAIEVRGYAEDAYELDAAWGAPEISLPDARAAERPAAMTT